jgi:hypothetical protein
MPQVYRLAQISIYSAQGRITMTAYSLSVMSAR